MKHNNEKRANRSLQTASKIYATRDRVLEKQKLNSIVVERRESETSERKTRANSFRIELKKNIQRAKRKMEEENISKGQEERQIQQHEEQQIKENKQKDVQIKREMAENVRKYEERHNERMHSYYQASRVRSIQNHHSRFADSVKEKNKFEKILIKLQKQEEIMRK